jgi:hypothetical protein
MDQDQLRMTGRLSRQTEPQEDIARFRERLRAFHPDSLDLLISLAQAGGIRQSQWNSANRYGHLDMIPCGAGDVRHDGSLISNYSIQKAGLPGIRRTSDYNGKTLFQRFRARARQPCLELSSKVLAGSRQFRARIDRIFVDIINRSFRPRRQVEQAHPPAIDQLAEATLSHQQRGPPLAFRLRLEKVGESLRLRQVDPAILECPARELAWLSLSHATAFGQRRKQRVDHSPSAMALKFNHIFSG